MVTQGRPSKRTRSRVRFKYRPAARGGYSVSEDADIALAVHFAELDYFEFDWGWVGLGIAQHMLARGRGVHVVGLDRQVVIVAEDKSHG